MDRTRDEQATASDARVNAGFELTRRRLLQLFGVVAGASLLPPPAWRRAAAVESPAPAGFLTSEELVILDAATARIVPSDDLPGARECGVVDYLQSMLGFMPGSDANCDRRFNAADITATVRATAGDRVCASPDAGDADGSGAVGSADVGSVGAAVFDAKPVFAGGPFSGRQAQAHFDTGTTPCAACHDPAVPEAVAALSAHGATRAAVVDNYPPDFFGQHLPLSRLQAMGWKVRILGAAAVPETLANPLARELPEVDLRNKYRAGLAALDAAARREFGKPFPELSAEDQDGVLQSAAPAFVALLMVHTVEGMLCAPEYGGNRDRVGWRLVGFDGDSQPLGYTVYDPDAPGGYRERDDKPNSRPDPDETCAGFSPAVEVFLSLIVRDKSVSPAASFKQSAYCFEVEK